MNPTAKILAAAAFAAMSAAAPAEAASRLPTIGSGDGPAFRSVRPPAPGAKRRITLQGIAAPGRAVPLGGRRGGSASGLAAAWFWSEVDSGLSAADPARLGAALRVLEPELARLGERLARPELLQDVLRRHGVALFRASQREDVSAALLLAVIAVESAGRERAVSPAGAQGLMQLMPATARRFGVSDPFDPDQNIGAGAKYLSILLGMFEGDALLALAAYNAGENAVLRHGGAPPYAETRDYVPKVAAAFGMARALCEVPPEGPRDPCALRLAAAPAAPEGAPAAPDPTPAEQAAAQRGAAIPEAVIGLDGPPEDAGPEREGI